MYKEFKLKALERQIKTLEEDHQAATGQRECALSAVEKNRLKRQIESIEREIEQAERELDKLSINKKMPEAGIDPTPLDSKSTEEEKSKGEVQKPVRQWIKYLWHKRKVLKLIIVLLLDFGLFKPPPRVDPARHPSHGKIIPTGRCRFWS